MARYLCFHSDGYFVQEGFCLDGHEKLQRPDLITVISDANPRRAYLDADFTVQELPPPPGPHYRIDRIAGAWVLDLAALDADLRGQRDGLLQACDWTQLPDVPLTTKTAWATYRQALRDLTDQPGWPTDVVWPAQP